MWRLPPNTPKKKENKMLTDQQIIDKYGQPGDPTNLTIIDLPYPMRIAWDLKTSVKRIQCHKLIAPNLEAVFIDLLDQYGLPELKKLEIDLFGGCVNVRLMRGSKTRWSRHAWGIAVDLSPEKNSLKMTWAEAQFSRPEYKKMVEIFYKHGFFSYGKDRNYDAMHFEISS
jgi:hypothetical protein